MPPLTCRNCAHGQHMRRCCDDVDCTLIVCLACTTEYDWLTGTWHDYAGVTRSRQRAGVH
jgi:hypothetical protein